MYISHIRIMAMLHEEELFNMIFWSSNWSRKRSTFTDRKAILYFIYRDVKDPKWTLHKNYLPNSNNEIVITPTKWWGHDCLQPSYLNLIFLYKWKEIGIWNNASGRIDWLCLLWLTGSKRNYDCRKYYQQFGRISKSLDQKFEEGIPVV